MASGQHSLRAPLAIRRGHELLYVYDKDMAMQYLFCNAGDEQPLGPTAVLASAAADVMNVVSLSCPDKRVKSLQDAIFHTRGLLDQPLHRQLVSLNASYSFLRHTPTSEIEQLAAAVSDALAAGGPTSASREFRAASPVSTPGLGVDVWTDGTQQFGSTSSTTCGSGAGDTEENFPAGSQGDWRSLPSDAWGHVHGRFLQRPEAIAAKVKAQVRALRREQPLTAYRQYTDLVLDEFGNHFDDLRSRSPQRRFRSWDELRKDYPSFSKNSCYDKLCERFDGGSKDPRHKSDEFLHLCSVIGGIWCSSV